MDCNELPLLEIINFSPTELSNLSVVVGDSGKQGIIPYNNLLQFIVTDSIPVGFVVDTFNDAVPNDWLLLDGSVFDQIVYPELFNLLGSNILPDYRGRTTEGTTLNPNGVGNLFGQESITLTEQHIPEHTHSYTDTVGLPNTINQGDSTDSKFEGDNRFKASVNPIDRMKTTEEVGLGEPVENIQPVVLVNKLIKAR